jgi:phenylalanyl-tRNA synthetase beta chain
MKISMEWVSDYVTLPKSVTPQALMHDLTMRTVEVEGVEDLSRGLDGVCLTSITALTPHPTRKNLQVAACDVGAKKSVQIVTAAKNVYVGMLAALAAPGARIAAPGQGDQDGQPRGRRVESIAFDGVASDGVLCGAEEIGLEYLAGPQSQGGLLDLAGITGAAGQSLAEVIGWTDILLEIDNKSLTNRPDLWCHWGIARELAAIYNVTFKEVAIDKPKAKRERLLGAIDAAFCPRFTATRFEGVRAQTSPLFIRSRLARIGQRPANLLVDLTNYVMFDIGQPCHAYDASQLTFPLGVRAARMGETIALLDGKSRTLEDSVYVITDADRPVAAAGVVGGKDSAVSAETTAIVLETAAFTARAVRRSARKLDSRTEAAARYEKAIDTQRVDMAITRFAALLAQCAPDSVASAYDEVIATQTGRAEVSVDVEKLGARLGAPTSAAEIRTVLTPAGFDVGAPTGGQIKIVAPTWRSTGDISGPHDILEEVARFKGYDNIVGEGVSVTIKQAMAHRDGALERAVKTYLANAAGMVEVLTYPWMDARLAEIAGVAVEGALALSAPPSPQESQLRVSLIPGLFQAIAINDPHFAGFRLFEAGTVFAWGDAGISPRPVIERASLVAAIAGDDPDALWRAAKGVVEAMPRQAHLEPVSFAPGAMGPWCDGNAALLITNAAGVTVGGIGLISPATANALGLKRNKVAVIALMLDGLTLKPSRDNVFTPRPERPEKLMDLSLTFANSMAWAQIQAVAGAVSALVQDVAFVDEFRGSGLPSDARVVTMRLTLAAPDHTLSMEEARLALDAVRARLMDDCGGFERADAGV